eukprot:Hpha_TRINITY_DN2467_c0_g1::TRINITY_DN2467_c0_g1_i1::g.24567::m.24567
MGAKACKEDFGRSKHPEGVVCISLHADPESSVRVIHPVPGLVEEVKKAIMQEWPQGIREERNLGDAHVIQIQANKGGTFWYAVDEQAVRSRLVVGEILKAAAKCGLELLVSSGSVTCDDSDLSSFFFRVGKPPATVQNLICISTDDDRRLRLIGAPREHQEALELAVVAAVEKGWPRGIKSGREFHGVPELQLNGSPWRDGCGEDDVHMRRLFLELLQRFEALGWVFYVSAKVSYKYKSYGSDAAEDSLYFMHVPEAACVQKERCCICVFGGGFDSLCCIDAPSSTIAKVKACVAANWPQGIQREYEYAGSHVFKFKGNPWRAFGKDAVYHQSLVIAILQAMSSDGWHVAVTRATCFYSRAPGTAPGPLSELLCVSINNKDFLSVVGGSPASNKAGRDAVLKAAHEGWPFGVNNIVTYELGTQVLDVPLKNYPWLNSDNSHCDNGVLYSRSMLCHVAKNLADAGLRPIISAVASRKRAKKYSSSSYTYPVDVLSWWVAADRPSAEPFDGVAVCS